MSSSRGRWGRWSHLAGEIALRPRSEAWGALRSSVWGIVDVNENEGCDHRVGKHRHRPHDKGYATLQCPRDGCARRDRSGIRSEEHTSELQSLMRISYAVFCLKKKNNIE